MNVTGFPRVPPAPMTARAKVSPSAQSRPDVPVSGRKPDIVDVGGVESRMMELGQKFNLRFLMLQQMQMENRKFTTPSNVMKTKHQTASAAISNVK